jgi:excinuclease ABC subunit C
MHEVITRRFRRLIDDRAAMQRRLADGQETGFDDEEGPLLIDPTTGAPRKFAYTPSLVVVDGGAPQVAAAAKALHELGIDDVALCGLAKRLEEVWLPDVEEPVILPRTSEGLCCSGCGTRRTVLRSPTIAPGAASRWWSHCSTRCPG